MNKLSLKLLFCGIFLFFFAFSAQGQNTSRAESLLKSSGKAAVIIVGKTAKITAKTVKFTAPIAFKATEKTTVFGFKTAKFLLKKSFPVGKKLFVTYLKTRISL